MATKRREYTDEEWAEVLARWSPTEKVAPDGSNAPSAEIRWEACRRTGVVPVTIRRRMAENGDHLPIREALTRPRRTAWRKTLEESPKVLEAAERLGCPPQTIVKRLVELKMPEDVALTLPYNDRKGRLLRWAATQNRKDYIEKKRLTPHESTFLQWPIQMEKRR